MPTGTVGFGSGVVALHHLKIKIRLREPKQRNRRQIRKYPPHHRAVFSGEEYEPNSRVIQL